MEVLTTIGGCTVLETLAMEKNHHVYLAECPEMDSKVVVKVLTAEVSSDALRRKGFLRELEMLKVLEHANVVKLEKFGEDDGKLFFTSEYCDSGSVQDLIRERNAGLGVEEATGILFQALDGLEHIHNSTVMIKLPGDEPEYDTYGMGSGLVHRDIKPANILLSGSGKARVAKIGDFWIAKAFDLAGLSGHTMTGEVLGTPQFMPVQQVINYKHVGPEIDVWAMAATLYFMLTCSQPRDFPDDEDPWTVISETRPVPIRQRYIEAPEKLAILIDEALDDTDRERGLKFKAVAEFRESLRKALE